MLQQELAFGKTVSSSSLYTGCCAPEFRRSLSVVCIILACFLQDGLSHFRNLSHLGDTYSSVPNCLLIMNTDPRSLESRSVVTLTHASMQHNHIIIRLLRQEPLFPGDNNSKVGNDHRKDTFLEFAHQRTKPTFYLRFCASRTFSYNVAAPAPAVFGSVQMDASVHEFKYNLRRKTLAEYQLQIPVLW